LLRNFIPRPNGHALRIAVRKRLDWGVIREEHSRVAGIAFKLLNMLIEDGARRLRFDLHHTSLAGRRQFKGEIEKLLISAQLRNAPPTTGRKDQLDQKLELVKLQLIENVADATFELLQAFDCGAMLLRRFALYPMLRLS
jgi:hypothetical protein